MKNVPRVKDNFNRFRKHAAVVINKELQERAEELDLAVKRMVRDKLEETYKDNVVMSYLQGYMTGGRGSRASYHHTGKFLKSIHSKIEGNTVKITIDDRIKYDNGKNAYDVYIFLTHGTEVHEEGYNPFVAGMHKTENGRQSVYKSTERRPIERRLFEDHTRVQMIAYLESLKNEFRNSESIELQKKYRKYLKHSTIAVEKGG